MFAEDIGIKVGRVLPWSMIPMRRSWQTTLRRLVYAQVLRSARARLTRQAAQRRNRIYFLLVRQYNNHVLAVL